MSEINVCIGNYGYYNEGELRDKWISLPKTNDEIQEFLVKNGLYDELHEEIYISDWDGYPFNFEGNIFSEYTPLESVNLLAKKIAMMPVGDYEKIEDCLGSMIDSPSNIIELLNLIEQVDDIPLYSYVFQNMDYVNLRGERIFDTCSPEIKYAKTLIETSPKLSFLMEHDPAFSCAFDIEEYGKESAVINDVELGDIGYIDNHQEFPACDKFTREELFKNIEAQYAAWNGESLENIKRECSDPALAESIEHAEKIVAAQKPQEQVPQKAPRLGDAQRQSTDASRELNSGRSTPSLAQEK